MSRSGRGLVLGGLVAGLLVAGCDPRPAPAPSTPGPLATVAASGAALVCGMDPADVAVAIGAKRGLDVTGSLSASGGVGSGECLVTPHDTALADMSAVTVALISLDSEEGREDLARIAGKSAKAAPANVQYADVLGAAWVGDVTPSPKPGDGASSTIVAGSTVIVISRLSGAPPRDAAADNLALARQVLHSLGLPGPTPRDQASSLPVPPASGMPTAG